MADPALTTALEAATLKERERFAQILVMFGHHGLKGLAARLGLGLDADEALARARPEQSLRCCVTLAP